FVVGPDHPDDVAAVRVGCGRADPNLRDVLGKPLQQPVAQLWPGLLSTTEHDRHLDLVAVFEEARDSPLLRLVVMWVDLGAELLLLDYRQLLVAAGLAGLLRGLIFELAV